MPFSPHPVRLPPETQPMCEEKGNICEALGFRPWKVLSCCHIPVGQLGTLKLRAGDVMPSGVKEMESS